MGSKTFLPIAVAIGLTISSSVASAEFVKLGPLAYASIDQMTAVIISKGNPPSAGIFVAIYDKTPIQEFDPAKLTVKNSRTLFIGYDANSSGFNKVVLPNGGQFSVQGSLTIAVNKTRVAIDNNYVSVVTEGDGRPSILGLVGLEPVLNLSGDTAIALTEGNKFLTQKYKDLIVNYSINSDGQLTINGKPFDGSRLGVNIVVDNPCAESDAVILTQKERERVVQAADRAKELQELRKNGKSAHTIADYLSLNVLNDSVVVLDFNSGEFGIVKAVHELGERVCEFVPAKLK